MSARPVARAAALLGLALTGCAADAGSRAPGGQLAGVRGYGRSPGMPIGTGAAGGALDAELLSLAELEAAPERPVQHPPPPPPPIAPCSGCVELRVHVNDINQRDEFALDAGGARVERVVWTLLVDFNSDQLAVQPFIDETRGEHTSLHVSRFPLGQPVTLEQEHAGPAHAVGLVVGSSGAWTGDQTMSVFVDTVRLEGEGGFERTFDAGPDGLAPRTARRRPEVVFHRPR